MHFETVTNIEMQPQTGYKSSTLSFDILSQMNLYEITSNVLSHVFLYIYVTKKMDMTIIFVTVLFWSCQESNEDGKLC